MGNVCFCCVSQDQRISKVLSKFPGTLPSNARTGEVQKIVGRCAMAAHSGCLQAPISGKLCVYYEVRVEELVQSGDDRRWVTVVEERMGRDFFLADDVGGSVYINAATTPVQVFSETDAGERSGSYDFFLGQGSDPSPGLLQLMARHGRSTQEWHLFGSGNKQLRASEACFQLGEAVAALGMVEGAPPSIALSPLMGGHVTPDYMERNGWEDFDKKSWASLTEKYPVVILSDSPMLVDGLVASNVSAQQVAPAPQQMAAPPQQMMAPPQQMMAPQQQMMAPPMEMQPQAPVAQVIAQPQVVTLQVPPGAAPGAVCMFGLPDGRQVQVQIPPGLPQGATFQAQV